jgi:hypothetical protein
MGGEVHPKVTYWGRTPSALLFQKIERPGINERICFRNMWGKQEWVIKILLTLKKE